MLRPTLAYMLSLRVLKGDAPAALPIILSIDAVEVDPLLPLVAPQPLLRKLPLPFALLLAASKNDKDDCEHTSTLMSGKADTLIDPRESQLSTNASLEPETSGKLSTQSEIYALL